jgi:hypothetical protein
MPAPHLGAFGRQQGQADLGQADGVGVAELLVEVQRLFVAGAGDGRVRERLG